MAVPLYDTFTDEVVGTFDQITFALGTKDCYFEAVYNLDENQRGISESQIMVSGTCFGLSDAVTGGTGEYACAAGKVERRETQNGKIEFHLIDVCHGCAA